MRRLLVALLIVCGVQAAAQDSALQSLETTQDGRGWEAVGRLDIAGKGFCTAALIGDSLILTAAHCLYDSDGNLIAPERFLFRAGLRSGRAVVERGVRRFIAHPDYAYSGPIAGSDTVGNDIALLELDQPIRLPHVQPFGIASSPARGDAVGIVSYAQGRADAPSLQEVCSVLGSQQSIVVMTCEINFGASGAPVFMINQGITQIVSVVSAMAQMDGAQVALGTSLGAPLNELRAAFDALGPVLPGTANRIRVGDDRNETSARFVTVPSH